MYGQYTDVLFVGKSLTSQNDILTHYILPNLTIFPCDVVEPFTMVPHTYNVLHIIVKSMDIRMMFGYERYILQLVNFDCAFKYLNYTGTVSIKTHPRTSRQYPSRV